jgi:hypothetical protein
MARMIPEEYIEDPESPSEAERILYRELKRQLPDDYVVFHRRPWHAPNASGSARDGEADFVIAHADLGILVVEAKSGGVARDPKTDRWHAVDYGGRRLREIDNPVLQALRCQKALLRRLQAIPAGAKRWWTIGHAVAFPEIDFDVDLFEVTPEIVLDRKDVPYLDRWAAAAMRHWADREKHQPPGAEGLVVLGSLLAAGFELRPQAAQRIDREEWELARLTAEQFRVLDGLARFRRALICGCAGSGKTMLAQEKVRRLAGQGLRTLYVCFNRQQRDATRLALKEWPRAVVENFHGLCSRWADRAGVPARGPWEDKAVAARDFYDQVLPAALAAAARKLPDDRFDAIVADEAQDFKPAYWGPLLATLKDKTSGVLYIFYDDNQKLHAEELRFPAVDTRFDLTENCRNVRRVHDLVARYYKAGRPIACRSPAGPRPEVAVYRSAAELLDAVQGALARFAGELKIPLAQIAVLTGHGKEKSVVWRARRFGEWTLADKPPSAPGEVFWSSVHGFKGLERSAIVLAEIEPLSHAELDTLLYVGCSRARVYLTVIASETAALLGKLEKALP